MYKISVKDAKSQLRKQYRGIRSGISTSVRLYSSYRIMSEIIRMPVYRKCQNLFVYVSAENEVDTRQLIEYALSDGKKVAVPYCIPKTNTMEFYYIRSLQDLHKGCFGIDEPSPEKCEKAEKKGLMIVPAMAFDSNGYRIGYGKGYYDRYLTDFDGKKIGIGYSSCFRKCIIHDRFDKKVDYIITDIFTKFVAK